MSFYKLTQHKLYLPISIAASLAVGFGAGILVDRLTSRKDREEACPDDWNPDFTIEEVGKLPEIPAGVNEIDTRKGEQEVDKILFQKPELKEYVDYTKFSDRYKDKKSNDVPKEVIDESIDFISIIGEDEFVKMSGNQDDYAVVTGSYFTQDKILAGWDSNLHEKEVEDTIGWKAVKQFDDPSVKAVYVRNDLLKVLYEVVRCNDPFEEAVAESEMNNETD